MTEMSGGHALAHQLVAEGVEVVFGLPGDQLMSALDAFVDVPELRYIVTRHEQGTTYMADGYARTSGRPGVAMVVPGVGVYNAAAGLATAYACSSPLLLLAGQVNRDGIGGDLDLLHQINDQLDVVRPVTKWAERVPDAAAIPSAVSRAFDFLQNGRPRPVELEFAPETFAESAEVRLLPPAELRRSAGDQRALEMAAKLLLDAKTPLVLAGGGVVLSDARDELTALVNRLQLPVLVTREGKGAIDGRHAMAIGCTWVNRRVQPVVDSADVILAVGTRFQQVQVRPDQRVVRIDVDEEQLERDAERSEVSIVGDARLALGALVELVGAPSRASRVEEARSMRAAIDDDLRAVGPATRIVDAVRAGVPDDGILVCDTTSVAYMCHMYYPVHAPRSYLSTSYMGTLGFGYSASLGAKVAAPDRAVVTVVGDGGFLFTASELATAVQHDIHTVTIVFDDEAYGNSNRDQRERFGGREYGTVLRNPDWVQLAHAFGAEGVRVDEIEKLAPTIAEAVAAESSTVISVPMDRLPSPF